MHDSTLPPVPPDAEPRLLLAIVLQTDCPPSPPDDPPPEDPATPAPPPAPPLPPNHPEAPPPPQATRSLPFS